MLELTVKKRLVFVSTISLIFCLLQVLYKIANYGTIVPNDCTPQHHKSPYILGYYTFYSGLLCGPRSLYEFTNITVLNSFPYYERYFYQSISELGPREETPVGDAYLILSHISFVFDCALLCLSAFFFYYVAFAEKINLKMCKLVLLPWIAVIIPTLLLDILRIAYFKDVRDKCRLISTWVDVIGYAKTQTKYMDNLEQTLPKGMIMNLLFTPNKVLYEVLCHGISAPVYVLIFLFLYKDINKLRKNDEVAL